jgi:hypothetical protein
MVERIAETVGWPSGIAKLITGSVNFQWRPGLHFLPSPVNFDVSASVDFATQEKFPGRPYRDGRKAAITVQSPCGGDGGVPETQKRDRNENCQQGSYGPMDKAPAYGAGDSGFESR